MIPTAEDVLIQKLRWHRDKDMDDARKVLQIQFPKLDWQYLEFWTNKHKTREMFERLRQEAEQ